MTAFGPGEPQPEFFSQPATELTLRLSLLSRRCSGRLESAGYFRSWRRRFNSVWRFHIFESDRSRTYQKSLVGSPWIHIGMSDGRRFMEKVDHWPMNSSWLTSPNVFTVSAVRCKADEMPSVSLRSHLENRAAFGGVFRLRLSSLGGAATWATMPNNRSMILTAIMLAGLSNGAGIAKSNVRNTLCSDWHRDQQRKFVILRIRSARHGTAVTKIPYRATCVCLLAWLSHTLNNSRIRTMSADQMIKQWDLWLKSGSNNTDKFSGAQRSQIKKTYVFLLLTFGVH